MTAGPLPSKFRVEVRTVGEEQTIALGMHLADLVRGGDVIPIDGELGAGKTRLVRGIAMGFGVPMDEVRSPTFALAHEYTVSEGRPQLVHIDAFRVRGDSPEELDSIGWDRLRTGDAVVVIEWAERVADRIPANAYRIGIAHTGVESRLITIDCPDERAATSLRALGAALQGASTMVHRCRTCGKTIDTSTEEFPFCSVRCKQADLGNWLSEKYRISRDVTERDLDEG